MTAEQSDVDKALAEIFSDAESAATDDSRRGDEADGPDETGSVEGR